MIKIVIGLVLGFAVGFFCGWAGIPSPAPPVITGALVVISMSVGYVATGRLPGRRELTTKHLCGGPTGRPLLDDKETP